MKWLSNRFMYPLVGLAIIASIGLQIAWLYQLFRAQQVQVKRDLELAVSNAARTNDYLSVVHGHEKSENFRDFFLSPDWLQFTQAFTNMRKHHVGGGFSSNIKDDSTIFNVSLRVANVKPKTSRSKIIRTFDKGETLASVMAADQRDIRRMDSLVKVEFKRNRLGVDGYHLLYDYDTGKPESPGLWRIASGADYHSQLYGYNVNFFFHSYQFVVPSINKVVIFRMRYYLVSSLMMLLITGLAFVFLFSVLRSQRLYTQARVAFTGNMTHELKTPVAIIEAALDSITRYQLIRDPAKLEKYLHISQSELQRLNLMIDKVLNLDQLDNGELKLQPELYDVQQGLESVVSSMQLRDGQKGQAITYVPFSEPCFVNGDPVHLTNVFYNLIDNALKYSGVNANVTVSCECDQEHVFITISDNGPGISKIYQERVFERFFRVPGDPDIHNVKGSGLGLHYVKQIINQHGGNVELRSEKGKSSTFIIDLPAYHEV